MTGYGVEPEDMTRPLMIDNKLNELLAGREVAPGDELSAELAHVLVRLHQAFPPAVVSEQVEDAHIARMMEAATTLPAAETHVPVAPQTSLLERIRTSLSRRVAVATVALSTAFGGAAYAGALPDPVQRAVATLAAMVGIELPNGDEGRGGRLPVTDEDDENTTNSGSPDDNPAGEDQSDGKDGNEPRDDGDGSGGNSGTDNPARQPDEDEDDDAPESDDWDDESGDDDETGNDRDDETAEPNETEPDDDEPDNDGADNDEPDDTEVEDPSDAADETRNESDEPDLEDAEPDDVEGLDP